MEIGDLDFQKCLIDPTSEDQVRALRKRHPEFKYDHFLLTEDSRDIKYVVLMYDINSPIRDMFSDYNERKVQAAMIAGYEVDEDMRFFRDVENALLGLVPKFNAEVVRYVIMHGMPDLIAFAANNEILASEMVRSLNASQYTPSELKTIRSNISSITAEQNELYKKIFQGEETQNLRNKLYETVEADRLNIRPEDIAKQLASNLFKPAIDPYEVGELERK